MGGVASQQDTGKIPGFSGVRWLPPQKRTLTPKSVRAPPLLPGLNKAPFGPTDESVSQPIRESDAPRA